MFEDRALLLKHKLVNIIGIIGTISTKLLIEKEPFFYKKVPSVALLMR